MSIETTRVAIIRHHETGAVHAVDGTALDWNAVGADERQMGTEVTYEADVDHPDLGLLTWTVWEYPTGVINHQAYDVGSHELLEDFRFEISNAEEIEAEREERIQAMVDWFLEHFEDPANSQPYESAEGGYIWIDGGPYDARDEISDQFSEESQDLIDAAVDHVQSDGLFDWARVDRGDHYEFDESWELEKDAEADDALIPDSISDIFASIPRSQGPIFELDARNRIELTQWTPSSQPDPSLLSSLRTQVSWLLDQLDGTNGHTELLDAVRGYASTVERETVSITEIYGAGVVMENVAEWTEAAIRSDDRPPLPGLVPATLRSVLGLHGTLVASTNEGLSLIDAAARYQRAPDAQKALTAAVTEVSELIKEAKDLFGPNARELVDQLAQQVGKGPQPARSNQMSSFVISSLLGHMVIQVGVGIFEHVVVGGLGATPAIAGLQSGVTAMATAAGSFIASNIDVLRGLAATVGSDLRWLTDLVDWVSVRRAGKSKE